MMGSHTRFFGLVLAMLALNSTYMQLLPPPEEAPNSTTEAEPQGDPSESIPFLHSRGR
ncbi:MAG: hypothetical protein NW237_11565 [Cyanobacteriota bacterium]|nr:hypothetical protein [Cyanobacteriota bacterium]